MQENTHAKLKRKKSDFGMHCGIIYFFSLHQRGKDSGGKGREEKKAPKISGRFHFQERDSCVIPRKMRIDHIIVTTLYKNSMLILFSLRLFNEKKDG